MLEQIAISHVLIWVPFSHPHHSIQQEKPSFYDELSLKVVPVFQTNTPIYLDENLLAAWLCNYSFYLKLNIQLVKNIGCNVQSNLCSKFLIALVWWSRKQLNSNLSFIFQFAKGHFSKSPSSNDGSEVASYAHNLWVAILLILWFEVGFSNHIYNKEDFHNCNMHNLLKNFKEGFVGICIIYVLNLSFLCPQIDFISHSR